MPRNSPPPPEGATLRFFRFSKGLNEQEMADLLGVSVHAVGRWEKGRVPLTRERLEELLGRPPLSIPPEAIAAALRAHALTRPPAAPGGPAELAGEDGRILERAALAAAMAGAEAAIASLLAQRARVKARRHRAWAAVIWDRIAKLSVERQATMLELLAGDSRSWALAERVSLASIRAAAHRADEALRLARLAVRLAERVPGSKPWRLSVLAFCEPFVANALRVGGDLAASALTFARADDLYRRGKGGDPAGLLDSSRRLDLKASLLKHQGRFAEALALIDEASERAAGDSARARLLLQKAAILELAGEYADALQALNQMELFLEGVPDRRLHFGQRFNMAVNLCHLEQYEEAELLLPQIHASAADMGNHLDETRCLWLAGRIWAGLGRTEQASQVLSTVRMRFLEEQIAYDFALASAELALLLLEDGQPAMVKGLALEMWWIFESQDVHETALAAISLFCEAASKEAVQVDWTRRFIKYLHRARYKPDLRFEP